MVDFFLNGITSFFLSYWTGQMPTGSGVYVTCKNCQSSLYFNISSVDIWWHLWYFVKHDWHMSTHDLQMIISNCTLFTINHILYNLWKLHWSSEWGVGVQSSPTLVTTEIILLDHIVVLWSMQIVAITGIWKNKWCWWPSRFVLQNSKNCAFLLTTQEIIMSWLWNVQEIIEYESYELTSISLKWSSVN
jgi:hypothetical protein